MGAKPSLRHAPATEPGRDEQEACSSCLDEFLAQAASAAFEEPQNAPSSSSTTTGRAAPIQLFVLVHGIAGCKDDWKLWEERMRLCGRQDWVVRPATSITEGGRFAGDDVGTLASTFSAEVVGWARELLQPTPPELEHAETWVSDGALELSASSSNLSEAPAQRVVLNFICHSLGGIVLRAALPEICGKLDDEPAVSYGHMLTLSTPHLGVHTASALMFWKNLSWLIPERTFKQIHQITLQDGSDCEEQPASNGAGPVAGADDGTEDQHPASSVSQESRPGTPSGARRRSGRYLSQLADPDHGACRCLSRFRHATAVGATHWDVMVPFCTATISAENPFDTPNFLFGDIRSFWRIDSALGFREDSSVSRSARGGKHSDVFAAHIESGLDEGESNSRATSYDSAASDRTASNFAGRRQSGRLGRQKWVSSSDREVDFPACMLAGLASATKWRRVAFTLHAPWWGHADVHLFPIGKDPKVLDWSKEFIDLMVSMFLEDEP